MWVKRAAAVVVGGMVSPVMEKRCPFHVKVTEERIVESAGRRPTGTLLTSIGMGVVRVLLVVEISPVVEPKAAVVVVVVMAVLSLRRRKKNQDQIFHGVDVWCTFLCFRPPHHPTLPLESVLSSRIRVLLLLCRPTLEGKA